MTIKNGALRLFMAMLFGTGAACIVLMAGAVLYGVLGNGDPESVPGWLTPAVLVGILLAFGGVSVCAFALSTPKPPQYNPSIASPQTAPRSPAHTEPPTTPITFEPVASDPIVNPPGDLTANSLTVSFRPTEDDVLAGMEYLFIKSPAQRQVRKAMAIVLAGIVAYLLLMNLPILISGPSTVELIVIVVSIGACLTIAVVGVMFSGGQRKLMHRKIIDAPGRVVHLAPTTVTVASDGLSTESQYVSARYPWAAVMDVGRTDEIIALRLNPAIAPYVPIRAFADPRDAERFYELATHYHVQAAATRAADFA